MAEAATTFTMMTLHFSTVAVILIPIVLLIIIRGRSKGGFTKALTWLLMGIIPLVLPHFLGGLKYFGINLLPEGIAHMILDHGAIIIAILSLTYFLYWFNLKFVAPIYSKKK